MASSPTDDEPDDDGLDDVRALLPDLDLELVQTLGGSRRSEVRRVRVQGRARRAAEPGEPGETLIVKTFVDPGEGWARESAGLSVLTAQALTPRLIAAIDLPPIVVMTDAGPGVSVADALLGADPVAAAGAVERWAEALGRLHCATLGSRADFAAKLSVRSGDSPVLESSLADDLDKAAAVLAQSCGGLGVDFPTEAALELRGLADRLSGDGPAALTPSDACPDNNVQSGDGLVLIDFEGAQWRHIAWDVAYLTVPWPSCWCAWRLPDDVARQAIARYRSTVADHLPYVTTPEFAANLALAEAGWLFLSTSWFLPRALDEDAPLHPNLVSPQRRPLILHRLDTAAQHSALPALAELAGRLRAELVSRWGEQPLPFAPAFA